MTARDAIAAYHALLAADPAAAREQADWMREQFARAGVTFGDEPMRSFLRPQLVEHGAWELLRERGRRLLQLAERVARRAFGGDASRLCAYLGTPAAEVPWVVHDPGEPDVVLSRLDAFLTPAGPRFIELNSDAPAGFGYGDRMAGVIERLPVFRAFARTHPVAYRPSIPALLDAVLACAGDTQSPSVAIVDWAEVRTRGDQQILCEAFLARGVRCRLADPRAMDVHAGGLWCAGERIDLVYRRGVLSELVAKQDEVRGLLQAYREGLAVFVNTFRCHLSEDKAFLALLTDEAFASLLAPEERSLLAACVPWTRKLEERRTLHHGRSIDLLPWVLTHREELVLKPAHAYGGRSVLVGDETGGAEWEAAVRAGLGQPWVVQERVPIPAEEFPVFESGELRFEPLKLNANPFYVAGGEAGAVTRVSRESVINVSAGGGSVPVFVLG